ncbi:amidase [Candidatus Vecturithrix granuli]|uniref:Amidase n=1 Tax=Vecturithrix granuli TaxID=1499967 RepID=A0A081BVU0_VECG1|nr:amidase [Candidatus Vecturithrix granuli]
MITQALLAETAQALRSGTLDVIEYLNELCDRIEAYEGQVQAFVPENDRRQRLLREAEDLKQRYPDPHTRPSLYGIPVGIKDIFRVDGFPTRAGSDFPPGVLAGDEASWVTKLREAGALIAGKTVTTEFAYFEPGPTRNPHNLEHTPGGSSSGSAAGVACGFFPLAFGTQTIGSVIRPAAFCGIIGFKPSFDRISTDGLIIFSRSADHVGLFTQDIEGMELAASLLCHNWQSCFTDSRETEERPVVGVPEGKYLKQASYDGMKAFETQVQVLEDRGYTVKCVPMFDDIASVNHSHRQMTAAEVAQEHAEWFETYRDRYRPRTLEIILKGQQISSSELEIARAGRLELRQQIEEAQTKHGIDVWVSPAAPGEAPKGIHATGDPIMNLPWTYAGVPTITVPAGMSKNHLPIGLQCSAAFMHDERLLAWMPGIMETLKHG